MTLNEKLAQIRERSKASLGAEIFEIYDRFIAHLRTQGFTQQCLKAGDRIPDFVLPNAEGRLIDSRDLLAQGPLAICFFRGDWCPYCRQELEALSGILPELEPAGATLVAITPDAAGHPMRMKRRFGVHYEILSDIDCSVGLQFGVVFKVPDSVRDAFTKLGIDLSQRHTNEGLFLPIPATFIVDQSGIIRHADLDPDWRRRMEPEEIVAMIAALGRH